VSAGTNGTAATEGDALDLALVVVAYNEATNVPVVLPEILAWLRARRGAYELLFVDDGSTDATRAAAERVCAGDARCRVLAHPRNAGIGAAIKTGVRAATAPWVTFLPCDGQIPVGGLDALTAAAVREGVRVVFSVYRARDDGAHRKLLSAGVRAIIRGVHGVAMRSDGPYLFRRELFDADVLVPDTFFLNFEFPIRMLRAREPHATVTIECVPRISGTSKSTGWRRIAGVARDLLGLKVRLLRGR
jgi:dolichol-phosphate mannosyltransferase